MKAIIIIIISISVSSRRCGSGIEVGGKEVEISEHITVTTNLKERQIY